ncbi:MAG: hypothetical protein NUV98_01060 [Candidatus Roizmanbacteria bacterium]|nr:hypothetical protein [Candidatus Roizmanbacteria bacterium]
MNRYIVIFIVLFFLTAIGIGIVALFKETNFNSGAGAATTCPPQTLPENKTCPEGYRMKLVEDNDGCYIFACQ